MKSPALVTTQSSRDWLKIIFASISPSNPLDTSFPNGSSSNFNRNCEILWNIQHERRKSIHVWTFHRMMKLLFQLRRKVFFSSLHVSHPVFSCREFSELRSKKCKFKQMCLELWFIKSRLNNKIFHSRPHARTSFALPSDRLVADVHLWLHLGNAKSSKMSTLV